MGDKIFSSISVLNLLNFPSLNKVYDVKITKIPLIQSLLIKIFKIKIFISE